MRQINAPPPSEFPVTWPHVTEQPFNIETRIEMFVRIQHSMFFLGIFMLLFGFYSLKFPPFSGTV